MKTTFSLIPARYTDHPAHYPLAIFSSTNRSQIAVFNRVKSKLKMNTSLKTTLIPAINAISRQDEMWALYNNYYKVSQQSFFDRFKVNDYYAFYTVDQMLVGFTGFRTKKVTTSKGTFQTLYIGQTVIQDEYRGKSLIPGTCCWIFIKHFLTKPFTPLYVWCDSLTYKPYLLFANSLKKYYPSRHEPTPSHIKALTHELGAHYYKTNYNPENGTVQKPFNAITDNTATITEQHLANPDIRFYAQKNSDYKDGHGLIILAPITLSNLFFLMKKCIKKRLG